MQEKPRKTLMDVFAVYCIACGFAMPIVAWAALR